MDAGRRIDRVVGLASALALAACGGSASAPPAGARLGPAVLAAIAAADATRVSWRCGAATGPALADETLTIDGHAWKLAGHTMAREGDGAISIGVIADAGGAAPPTLAALGRLRAKLADVDVVLALGGMGTTRAELEATLGALADRATWPLVVLPGDLEAMPDLVAAITALRARGLHVFDGRLAQRIELSRVVIAAIAGAGDPRRLVAGVDGCGYRPEDVAATFAELAAHPGMRIVASAEAPRITIDGEVAGELVLVPVGTRRVDLALHGPVDLVASPARTGTRDGAATPLTPGTSDATTRLPGPRHATTAGLLTVNGAAWRWRPIADID